MFLKEAPLGRAVPLRFYPIFRYRKGMISNKTAIKLYKSCLILSLLLHWTHEKQIFMDRIKKCSLFLFFLVLSSLSLVRAQERKIEGYVLIDGVEPAELALVALHSDSISTKPRVITYADKKGYYQINMSAPFFTKYIVEVRYVGCDAILKEISIDSIKNPLRCDFDLNSTSQKSQLQDVVVTAKRKLGVDKQSYFFNKEAIQRAQNSLDLALTLPQVKADASSGRIISATGDSSPTILINGHYASNEELRSIPPSKIIRIDYFDIAPERYNTGGSVIDIVTKPLDNGHHAGVEASVAPFATDAVARLYYNYNSGNHQFKLFSNNFVRHTAQGRKEEQEMQYTTSDLHRYESVGVSHIRLRSHLMKASYAYRDPGKQYIELSLSSNIEKTDNPLSYDALVQIGQNQQHRLGETTRGGTVFTPVVDIYYDRVLRKGSRLYSNIVYTHNQTHTEYNLTETDASTNQILLEEYLDGNTSKNSLIAQIEYAYPLKHGWFNVGSQFMYSHASFSLNGISLGETKDRQHQLRDRLYATWEGSLGRFFYRATPSLNMHYASAHKGLDESQTRWSFSPRLLLGYTFPKNHRLRWEVETVNMVPEIGNTAEVIRQIREDLFFRNNPLLENSYAATMRLYHTWSHAYVDLFSTLTYNYIDKDWILNFERTQFEGRPVIVQQQINSRYSQSVSLRCGASIKPLGNEKLIIRLYAQPRYQQYKLSQTQQVSLFSIPAGGSITYQQDNWGMQGDIDLPYKRLHSYFTSSSGWNSSLATFWRKGAWNLRLSLENLFVPESSKTINHPFLLVQEKTNTFLRDNKWKVSFSVAYYFSVGKSYKGGRQLENEDTDRGAI